MRGCTSLWLTVSQFLQWLVFDPLLPYLLLPNSPSQTDWEEFVGMLENEPLFPSQQQLQLPKITSLSDLISKIRLSKDPRWKHNCDKEQQRLCPFSSPLQRVPGS